MRAHCGESRDVGQLDGSGRGSVERGGDRRHAAVIPILGIAQIVSYGTLYYSVSIVAEKIALDFDRPPSWIFGAFSGALFLGALASVGAGRLFDAFGAGRVMCLSSVAAGLSLTIAAIAPSFAFFVLGLVGMQVVSACLFYEAAFTHLVQRDVKSANRQIAHLTLVVGFSSTIFWPLTAYLADQFSWRTVFLIYATGNLLVALPAHLWLARPLPTVHHVGSGSMTHAANASATRLPASRRSAALVLVILGFSMTTVVFSAVLGQMVPLLSALGLSWSGVLVSTIFGPAQVVVRLMASSRAMALWPPIQVTLVSCVALTLALLILAIGSAGLAGAIAFTILLGFSSGLNGICRGTLPLDLFGEQGYGRRMGAIAAIRLVLASAAPFAFAYGLEALGVFRTLETAAATSAAGAVAFAVIWGLTSSHTSPRHRPQTGFPTT